VLSGRSVSIIREPGDLVASERPAGWAVDQVREALEARSVPVRLCERLDQASSDDLCLLVAGCQRAAAREILGGLGASAPEGPEALALAAGKLGGREVLLAGGSDLRGLTLLC
jgi:hypothetical protein